MWVSHGNNRNGPICNISFLHFGARTTSSSEVRVVSAVRLAVGLSDGQYDPHAFCLGVCAIYKVSSWFIRSLYGLKKPHNSGTQKKLAGKPGIGSCQASQAE